MADCIDPAAMRGEDLAAYALDSDGDEAIKQHVAQCPACAAEVDEMRALTTQLGNRLTRFDCPTATELDAYLAQDLLPTRQAEVTQHLQQCSRCAEEVAMATEFFAQEDPLFAWLAATPAPPTLLRRLVAALQSHTGSAATPALALRGTAHQANTPQIYTIEDVSISLRHLAEPQSQLQGIISVAENPDVMMTAIPVKLLSLAENEADPTPFAETTTEMGFFTITPMPAGRYQLEITLPERLIVIETLIV